jgi:zinc transport system permease protein
MHPMEALQMEFMRNALWAGLLVSIACGIMGALVVVNRIVFISGGIAHAAYGGIGLAIYTGISPLLGATLFSLLIALLMGLFTFGNREGSDTVIGVMWAAGMGLGIILVDLTPGYHPDLMSYLFGSILAVSKLDLCFMALLDGLIVLIVVLFYKELLGFSYDDTFSATRGVPVRFLHFLLLILIALSVVMLIRIVGLILVIALLTIPASIAGHYTCSLKKMMQLGCSLGAVFILLGLWLSYRFNMTSGATIVLVACGAFLCSAAGKAVALQLARHRRSRRNPGLE